MENDLDQQTLDLMIELQLQDARNMIKGKHRHGGEARDCEVAAKIFEKELQNLASFYVDRAMSRSIAHAVVADEVAIAAHLSEEQQASNDRAFALRGQPQTKVPTPSKASPDTAIEDEMMQRLIALYIGDSRPPSAAGPSSARAGPSSASRTTTDVRRCAACISDFPFYETARCPCSHDYCRDCITELFSAAINDESLYPPRCCKKPIPLGLNRIFLPAELLGLYKAKELEYSTPNRTYCHVPSCSTFVPPAFVHGDVATCVKCESTTCTICKGKTHTGDCPADMSTLDILRIAAKNGWQRCYSCRRVVDLTMGCNHISRSKVMAFFFKFTTRLPLFPHPRPSSFLFQSYFIFILSFP